jgi:hypothetical protein
MSFKESSKGFTLMPKRVIDPMSAELFRGVRLTQNWCEYVSFGIPRKTGGFHKDLYPDCVSKESPHDF